MTSCITGLGGTPGPGYFTDNLGAPKLWVATETWGIIVNAGAWTAGGSPANYQTEMSNFLSARAAQGVTVVMTDPVWSESSNTESSGGNAWDGTTPLAGGSKDPSTAALNGTFWARLDYLLTTAASYGITIAPTLWNNNNSTVLTSGWTSAQWTAWAQKIAARYLASPNLIWLFGNDAWPSGPDATWDAIRTGISNAGDTRPQGAWYEAEYTSRYDTHTNTVNTWGAAHSDFNFCYTYNAGYWVIEYAYGEVISEGAANLIPVILGDGYFYQGAGTYSATYDRAQRQENWWTLASGARGILFESEAVYPWTAATCVTNVTAEWYPSHNLANAAAAFTSWAGWHKLLPDLSSAFVTAGRGTRVAGLVEGGGGGAYEPAFTNSWVAASITPDGSLAVCYLPGHTTITCTTSMLASGWTAHWIDPVTGASSSAGSGPTFNSTAKGTNSQGDPDWVLVFATPSTVNATVAPGSALAVTTTLPAPAATVTYSSGPNYASAQATGSGGQGSWVNPAKAEGAPDGSFTTWAVP